MLFYDRYFRRSWCASTTTGTARLPGTGSTRFTVYSFAVVAAAGVPQLLRGRLVCRGPALRLRVLPRQPQPDVGHVQPGTCYRKQ